MPDVRLSREDLAAIEARRTRGWIPINDWGPVCAGCGGVEYRIDGERPIVELIAELQTGNADVLTLLGFYEAPVFREYELHLLFAAHHVRGEWFEPAEELLGHIAERKA